MPCSRCSDRNLSCRYPVSDRITSQNDTNERRDTRSTVIQTADLSTVENRAIPRHDAGAIESDSRLPDADDIGTQLGATVLSDVTGEAALWNDPFGEFATMCDVEMPGLGPLGINWISPRYQYDMDWNIMPDEGAIGPQIDQLEPRASHGTVSDVRYVVNGSIQQLQQATPSIIIPSCDNAQTAITTSSVSGEYYVNSDGPRAPFGRRHYSDRSASNSRVLTADTRIRTTSTEAGRSSDSPIICTQEAYDKLLQIYAHGSQANESDTNFTPFPRQEQIEFYVQQYFAKFNPIFPFLRQATFMEEDSHTSLLLLAVAALGSKSVPATQDSYRVLLRTLNTALESRQYGNLFAFDSMEYSKLYVPGRQVEMSTSLSLRYLQAEILHLVCLLQSGMQDFMEKAIEMRPHLVSACNSLKLLERNQGNSGELPSGTLMNADDWLRNEARIRTGMALWVSNGNPIH